MTILSPVKSTDHPFHHAASSLGVAIMTVAGSLSQQSFNVWRPRGGGGCESAAGQTACTADPTAPCSCMQNIAPPKYVHELWSRLTGELIDNEEAAKRLHASHIRGKFTLACWFYRSLSSSIWHQVCMCGLCAHCRVCLPRSTKTCTCCGVSQS